MWSEMVTKDGEIGDGIDGGEERRVAFGKELSIMNLCHQKIGAVP